MALIEKQKGDDEKHPNAWYHPIEDRDLASKAVKYTLSRQVDVIVPPVNINHFRWALDYMKMELKITQKYVDDLEKVAEEMTPLFPLKAR